MSLTHFHEIDQELLGIASTEWIVWITQHNCSDPNTLVAALE